MSLWKSVATLQQCLRIILHVIVLRVGTMPYSLVKLWQRVFYQNIDCDTQEIKLFWRSTLFIRHCAMCWGFNYDIVYGLKNHNKALLGTLCFPTSNRNFQPLKYWQPVQSAEVDSQTPSQSVWFCSSATGPRCAMIRFKETFLYYAHLAFIWLLLSAYSV